MRIEGATHEELAAVGWGFMSTVRSARAASVSELVNLGRQRLNRMMAEGTTTVEAKTDYGLTVEDEMKELEAIAFPNKTHPVGLCSTFFGPYLVPLEFKGSP